MHTDILVAERTPEIAQSVPLPVSSARQMHSALKELQAAKKFITSVSLIAHNRLSENDRYELTAAEGLIAGAIKKIEAATS